MLDEPFAPLDAQTRADLQDLLLDLWDRNGLTVLFVTHDIDEAVHLGDRVVVLAASPTRTRSVAACHAPLPMPFCTSRAV